ncbi:MAG TPA: regulatory protein RecX [Steroidobacteraceae bacterium]|nr:regulatory protein RecX [Steroidobacteraceae bacterium]
MLRDRGYDAQVADRIVAALLTERLLDDRRFVADFIAYHAARGHGPLRVRADLRRKGVEGELVEGGLDAFPGWLEELEGARRKKFGARRPDAYPERMRQAQFLSYRGFTSAQIRSALGSAVDLED